MINVLFKTWLATVFGLAVGAGVAYLPLFLFVYPEEAIACLGGFAILGIALWYFARRRS